MNIGKILDFLDENNLADNTLVCFFSDHGEMGGSHHYFQKACFYDESIKIPFIMRLPDSIPSGIVKDEIAGSIDLFPTTASICNVPVPDGGRESVVGGRWSGVGGQWSVVSGHYFLQKTSALVIILPNIFPIC